ncbi:hypothetical protein [Streptomyces sp. IMTB 1903]|uniref:hypothetical protein n=1 Tax=Streptomyces sp. IMTB 1903 TaxID=1776680 RepID=UPI00075C7A1A|nr:hypothetical protein [Streptomyces sp. IMTB 1903]
MVDEDSGHEPPPHTGRWRRTKRFVTSTKGAVITLGAVAGAVASVWGLVELIRGDDEPEKTAAELVRECEVAHKMNGATEKITSNDGTTLFASCTWPPSPLADPDGYQAITVRSEELPGGAEATGDTTADRVTGPCASYTLTYTYNHMGQIEHTDPVTLAPGRRVFFPTLAAWEGALPFMPGRDELVVIHGLRYEVDEATCA